MTLHLSPLQRLLTRVKLGCCALHRIPCRRSVSSLTLISTPPKPGPTSAATSRPPHGHQPQQGGAPDYLPPPVPESRGSQPPQPQPRIVQPGGRPNPAQECAGRDDVLCSGGGWGGEGGGARGCAEGGGAEQQRRRGP